MEKREELCKEFTDSLSLPDLPEEIGKWIKEVLEELDKKFEYEYLEEAEVEYGKNADENTVRPWHTLRKHLLYYYKNVNQMIGKQVKIVGKKRSKYRRVQIKIEGIIMAFQKKKRQDGAKYKQDFEKVVGTFLEKQDIEEQLEAAKEAYKEASTDVSTSIETPNDIYSTVADVPDLADSSKEAPNLTREQELEVNKNIVNNYSLKELKEQMNRINKNEIPNNLKGWENFQDKDKKEVKRLRKFILNLETEKPDAFSQVNGSEGESEESDSDEEENDEEEQKQEEALWNKLKDAVDNAEEEAIKAYKEWIMDKYSELEEPKEVSDYFEQQEYKNMCFSDYLDKSGNEDFVRSDGKLDKDDYQTDADDKSESDDDSDSGSDSASDE